MTLERKNYLHLAAPVGPYVHAVKYNGLLFVSGLSAFGSPSQTGSVAEQAEEIFTQLESIAAAEQSSLESLIKVTLFVTSLTGLEDLRAVLFRRYGSHLPASSLVQVKGLFSPDLQIEVEAILATPAEVTRGGR
jgi:2-iminobutanoate/2-iminopropanoate deaminase